MPRSDTQFKPGHPRPNGAGRKKGSRNKKTLALQSAIQDLALGLIPDIKRRFDEMGHSRYTSGLDHINLMLKFLGLVPRQTTLFPDDPDLESDLELGPKFGPEPELTLQSAPPATKEPE
jgi:hypothetical protein